MLGQGYAHGERKKEGRVERSRVCQGSPELEKFGGGNGGSASSSVASLAARSKCQLNTSCQFFLDIYDSREGPYCLSIKKPLRNIYRGWGD